VSPSSRLLGLDFFARPAPIVARELLGALIVSTVGGRRAVGRIVETEAYTGPEDPASHAAERIGRTRRNQTMFGPPGRAYVYRIYGVHWCLNAVTDREGHPGAVLIRAAEPLAGLGIMRTRRFGGRPGRDNLLASGPGRLAQALGVTGALDGHRLDRGPLRLCAGEPLPDAAVGAGPRIGISRAADWPLRFFELGNPHVSA
jgi:DNA-3-methyladenine glycosylase